MRLVYLNLSKVGSLWIVISSQLRVVIPNLIWDPVIVQAKRGNFLPTIQKTDEPAAQKAESSQSLHLGSVTRNIIQDRSRWTGAAFWVDGSFVFFWSGWQFLLSFCWQKVIRGCMRYAHWMITGSPIESGMTSQWSSLIPALAGMTTHLLLVNISACKEIPTDYG